MNREIEFRGKAKSDGLWEYGSLWFDKGKYYINGTDSEWVEVIPETVGQYTGLKDKNGREIYEGDILKVGNYTINEIDWYARKKDYYKNDDLLVVVSVLPILDVRDINDYVVHIKHGNKFVLNGCMKRPRAEPYEVWNGQRTLEVIGNIHENKELLEGEE